MSAFMIAQIEITDPERYQEYLAGFLPIFQRHEAELLATSSCSTEVVEGDWALPRTVIMKFPSREAAEAWHRDPEYQALARHRHAASRANLVLVEGLG